MKNPLIDRFKACFENLHQADLSQFSDIYASDILFRDPVHEVHGLGELEEYMTSICRDLSECRFEFLDELATEQAAYIKWIMHFRHPRMANRLISVRGVSHLKFSERIDYHEDLYDMGAMLYEQLPLLGSVTRWLKLRLAS